MFIIKIMKLTKHHRIKARLKISFIKDQRVIPEELLIEVEAILIILVRMRKVMFKIKVMMTNLSVSLKNSKAKSLIFGQSSSLQTLVKVNVSFIKVLTMLFVV